MIPVKQRGENDCVRAAVASILERDYEAVPNFMDQAVTGRWWGGCVDDWLAAEGYPFRMGNFAFYQGAGVLHEVFMQTFWLGDPWWFASIKSKWTDGDLHAVVMHGNDVAFDPGIHAEESEYRDKPYEFIFANYFYVPDPAALSKRAEERLIQLEGVRAAAQDLLFERLDEAYPPVIERLRLALAALEGTGLVGERRTGHDRRQSDGRRDAENNQ